MYQSPFERIEHDGTELEKAVYSAQVVGCICAMIGFRTAASPSISSKSTRSNVTTTPASPIRDGPSTPTALVPRHTGSFPLRTLDDVRDQISQEIAINTITKAEYMDGKTNYKHTNYSFNPFFSRCKNRRPSRHLQRKR